ncbi:MAG: undecaprenyl diphosphate synthase family protein [archaeon]
MVEIPILSNLTAKGKKNPIHIAINSCGVKSWAEEHKKDLAEAIKQHISLLNEVIDYQLKYENRVLSIGLSDTDLEIIPAMKDFFRKLINDERIHKNQMRVFIIGQWFEMDMELTELFKDIMEKTKNYDNFFLNFCIRYDGQEEILGAIRLMIRKIMASKMKEEDITPALIKENLYSSYFPPPQLIIETSCTYSGLLLWDAKGAIIYSTDNDWLDFGKREYEKAIDFFTKTACRKS